MMIQNKLTCSNKKLDTFEKENKFGGVDCVASTADGAPMVRTTKEEDGSAQLIFFSDGKSCILLWKAYFDNNTPESVFQAAYYEAKVALHKIKINQIDLIGEMRFSVT